MELPYRPSESTVRQADIQIGTSIVYIRRNFKQVEKTLMEGEEPTLFWEYEEAQITKNEALLYFAENQKQQFSDLNDIDSMMVDQEYRLTLLELGINA